MKELIEILDIAPNDYGYVKYHFTKYIDEMSKMIDFEEFSFIWDKYFVNFSNEQNADFIKSYWRKHVNYEMPSAIKKYIDSCNHESNIEKTEEEL
ncbi:MAG: hypothetical protein ULS35scaffold63_4 [Phage 33_17]|nr:MAG: hypothetical protein ULS35scaffold63_4 [Phage 33_17]